MDEALGRTGRGPEIDLFTETTGVRVPAVVGSSADAIVERRTPPDQAERGRILAELATNLLVEAGAGSGKTTAMVGRMVRLIRTGTATMDQIAAVTFTRKAASELRERFQEVLEREYRRLSAECEARGAGCESPPVALTHLEEEVERLGKALREIDRCFCGTIHSFCGRLLRERPLEAGVPPGFREVSGAREDRYLAECWERFLEHLSSRRSPLLARLAKVGLRPAQLQGAFKEVSGNPDVRWAAPRVERLDRAEIEAVQRTLQRLLDDSSHLMPEAEPDKGWDDLQIKIRSLRFSRYVLGWESDLAFLDALATAVGKKHKITQYKWGSDRAAKQAAKDLCAEWDEFCGEEGPAARLLEQWLVYRYPVAIRFARAASAFYATERLRSGNLNFQDLLLLTARLLRTDEAARRELGERYRFLLVDEFQDTDPVQAEVVFLLAAGNECGGDWSRAVPRSGALFVVGDPKQSIYRFRRADIVVYNQVKRRFREFGAVLKLTANFRSTPPVEALVEKVFNSSEMLPAVATEHQAAFAPLNVNPAPGRRQGIFSYQVEESQPGKGAAGRLAPMDATQLATWIEQRIRSGERQARDFMILTSTKHPLAEYARALEARDIPVQVSGAQVGMEEELKDLVLLLRALADPGDPVLTLAVLESLFFGLSHEQLYAHTHAGGGFGFTRAARPEGPVASALGQLRDFWGWVRSSPADVAVPRIVERLGLLPYAAAGDRGATRAGALVYAMDALRVAGLDGHTSLTEAIEVLDAALEAEAEAPLMPGDVDAVRVMNLHKAKGLEAKVVILACPALVSEHGIDRHISRSDHGEAMGWLQITDSMRSMHPPVIAQPPGWESYVAAERPFGEAEKIRLLYVAVTRTAEELLVSRCAVTDMTSCWAKLHPALDAEDLAEEVRLPPLPAPPRKALETTAEEIGERITRINTARRALRKRNYHAASVTSRVKKVDVTHAPERGGEGDLTGRGAEWGTAVHRALEAASRGLAGRPLRTACRSFLIDAGRPRDERGEPTELDELIQLVETLRRSALWRRARDAEQLLVEAPFSLSLSREDLNGMGFVPTDVDKDSSSPWAAPRQVVEGVIDLAFRENGGWVVADYKSDVFPSMRIRLERTGQYRKQLELYAACLSRITGEPVRERVLFFTSEGREEAW
ncbi:UvrD-helicase domain-containing protein [soil metagenome]